MDTKDIDILLERYFEGETSSEEEKLLRDYFINEPVADHLIRYKPLFEYFKMEIAGLSQQNVEPPVEQESSYGEIPHFRKNENGVTINTTRVSSSMSRRALTIVAGIAAIAILLLSVKPMLSSIEDETDSFAIIDGKYYTDSRIIKSSAMEALREVASDDIVSLLSFEDDDNVESHINDLSEIFYNELINN